MAEQSTNPKADLPPPPLANKDDATPPPVVAAAPVDKVDPPPSASKEDEPPLNPPPPAPASKEDPPPPEAAGDTEAAAIKDKEEPPPPKAPPTEPEAGEENRSLATMMEKEGSSPQPPPQETKAEVVAEAEAEAEAAKTKADPKIPQSLVSFKEESNVVADLSDSERDALKKLKELVREALNNHQFISLAPPPPPPKGEEKQTTAATTQEPTSDTTKPVEPAPTSDSDVSTELNPPQPESKPSQEEKTTTAAVPDEVSIWGIPLMKDDRSDVILLKFLRAREFKVKDAFTMIKNTIQWRRDFGIDSLMEEDLGDDLEKVVFMHGYDRDGHPVCYNVYGEFENKELYQKTFSDEEKRRKFLQWRIQFLEKSIRKLDFRPGGVNTIFQVNDLRNAPGPGKRELRLATKQALQLLQDNYPEFVAKQVFINVPWWYLAFYTMISPFMTQRTKSKFVFVGPSKTAATLFKYISPEHVPILYGGLSVDYCDCNPEFTIADPVTDLTVKPGTKQTVEIIIYEKCVIVWEVRVVGWEVSYAAEFVPDAKDAYTVIIQKPTKMAPRDEPVVSNRFKVGELGKILLTIDNPTSKKKQLLYRFKIEPFSD